MGHYWSNPPVQPKKEEVFCPRCADNAVWVDHGPRVGRGWFCRTCKDDVDHPDNMYGLTADQIKRAKSKESFNASSGYGKMPTANVALALDCDKPACKVCGGKLRNPQHMTNQLKVHVAVNDMVRCDVDKGVSPTIQRGKEYKIAEVLSKTIRIFVVKNGMLERREYTRCRFSLV